MKDCNGVELQVGNNVAYILGKTKDCTLSKGIVTKLYKGHFGDECSVDNHPHILSSRVMKLGE